MTITGTSLSIVPLATGAPKWWRPYREPNFAALDAHIAEMNRLVDQYPGRRQTAAARPSFAAAIYADRAAQAALPRARDPLCAPSCYEKAAGRAPCDGLLCRATVKMRTRPRSIHDVLRERRPTR
jgi:hypothetical protein